MLSLNSGHSIFPQLCTSSHLIVTILLAVILGVVTLIVYMNIKLINVLLQSFIGSELNLQMQFVMTKHLMQFLSAYPAFCSGSAVDPEIFARIFANIREFKVLTDIKSL